MKVFACIFALVNFYICEAQPINHKRNKIDDATSTLDIQKIANDVLGKQLKDWSIDEKPQFSDTGLVSLAADVKPASWNKADFDGNGYTDLLIIEKITAPASYPIKRTILIIMDSGENRFFVRTINQFPPEPAFPLVTNIDDLPAILYYHYKRPSEQYYKSKQNRALSQSISLNTLVFKYDDFVFYNKNPDRYNIESIRFETSQCFGMCPEFKITINQDGSATYAAILFNKDSNRNDVKGVFTGSIDRKNYKEIIDILKGLNLAKLRNNYSVDWTDDQTSILTVTYNNGIKKVIKDYGMQGTFGLKRLYELLTALRLNQNWH